jgi:hypothetical protein
MAGQERALEISQAGIETTRGTAVAATRKVYTLWQPINYERELQFASVQTGTWFNQREAAYDRSTTGFTGTEAVSFEDLPWWLQFILKGGVAGVTDAGSPPAYTYAFTPTVAADDLKSMTLEFGTPTLPYEVNQAMVNSATFRFTPDDARFWEMDVEVMSRKPTQVAMTGSITERTRELIKAPGTKIYVDSATIGTTQVTGRFIGGSITINNNLDFKFFSEDEHEPAANKVGRGDVNVDAEFAFEFDSDAEFANYRSDTPVERFIRIEREGTNIHTGTVVNKRARFDLNGYWRSVESGYRNNNKILTFGLGARYNTTSAYSLKAEVVNALITLP